MLRGLILPTLKFPISYINQGHVKAGDTAVLPTYSKDRDYLVVSQCCDLEKRTNVALAPIKSTHSLSDSDRDALFAERPNEESGYTFSQFGLNLLEGIVLPLAQDRQSCAALDEVATFLGARASFQSHVVARMTPAGRRLLRVKLSLFFGRAEAEDATRLAADGIAEGL